jgi:hypothetical protein
VAACADLVVEGAIDLVLLGTEDGGEIVGHDCGLSGSRRSSDANGLDMRGIGSPRGQGGGRRRK